MRVISGKYKGRNIKGFDIDGTRPTMDRVKESIFSTIQNYIDDSVVLDLFAGSGNLGIEAISNGAKECYFVDKNKIAKNVIQENINSLKIENGYVLNMDYKDALNNLKNTKFDLIFLDPPYKDSTFIDDSVLFVTDNNMLNENGLIICEYEGNIKIDYDYLEIYREKKYGSKKVVIFKK